MHVLVFFVFASLLLVNIQLKVYNTVSDSCLCVDWLPDFNNSSGGISVSALLGSLSLKTSSSARVLGGIYISLPLFSALRRLLNYIVS